MERARRVGSLVGRLRSLSRTRKKKHRESLIRSSPQRSPRGDVTPRVASEHEPTMTLMTDEMMAELLGEAVDNMTVQRPASMSICTESDDAIAAAFQALLSAEERTLRDALRASTPRLASHRRPVTSTRVDSVSLGGAVDSHALAALFAVNAAVDASDTTDVELPIPMSPLQRATVPLLGAVTRSGFLEGRGAGSESAVARAGTSWFDGWLDNDWLETSWLGNLFGVGPVPSALTCVACLDREADCCLVPCGHVIVCMACSTKLVSPQRCPICRAAIKKVVGAGNYRS